MKIITLNEGIFSVGNSKTFLPFDKQKDVLSSRERGSFLLAVQPFLIVLKNDVILVDTGLGQMKDAVLHLVETMRQAGYRPEQVTKVLLSHLHSDHIGGVFSSSAVQAPLTFPRATYYLQQRELEYALEQQHPSYNLELLNRIKQASQFFLMTENSGSIADGITYEVTGGHSPYHQVFWFTEGKQTFFYGADIAPQLFFVKNKMIGKYDFDGKKTRDLRSYFLAQAVQHDWTFLFYHDTEFPLWNPNKLNL